jgi:hypothetical protein
VTPSCSPSTYHGNINEVGLSSPLWGFGWGQGSQLLYREACYVQVNRVGDRELVAQGEVACVGLQQIEGSNLVVGDLGELGETGGGDGGGQLATAAGDAKREDRGLADEVGGAVSQLGVGVAVVARQ